MRPKSVRAYLILGLFAAGLAANPPKVQAGIFGFGDGTGYTLNYGPGFDTTGPRIANNVLSLTDNANLERRSVFFNTRQDIRNFVAHFQYQATPYPGTGLGDGITFTIQNDPRGVLALGNSGGGLGYEGITSSVAVELNLFSLPKAGTFLGVNGTTGSSQGGYLPTDPVALTSGDPISVDLIYNGSVLSESLIDLKTGAMFRMNFVVDIAAIVGGPTAYVGFTGGTGLFEANQTIGNFLMTVPEPASLPLIVIGLASVGGVAASRRSGRVR